MQFLDNSGFLNHPNLEMFSLNSNHVLDIYYDEILEALEFASEPFRKKVRKSFKVVPGWNEFCRTKYQDARAAFLQWVQIGKIRFGSVFENIKNTRNLFREALDHCKKNEQEIRDFKLVSAARLKDSKSFWREVNSRRSKNSLIPQVVDGQKTDQDICKLFANKFSSVNGSGLQEFSLLTLLNGNSQNIKFKKSDLINAVKSLKVGIGFDRIHSNHLKFIDDRGVGVICRFFNMCLNNGYLPTKMLEGVIRPCVKDKFGDISSSSNYREVMISSNVFKLFEYSLLPYLKRYNPISRSQFGYREHTSTTIVTALFKETVFKYINLGSEVYSCFLDLSKAFERVDHNLLLEKLNYNGTPLILINVLKSLFLNTSVSVCFNQCFSQSWKVRKGVRQGGVLSAFLFSLYIDNILKEISDLPYSCMLGINKLNILAYADDIVIFAPTSVGLQCILSHLNRRLNDHFLMVNVTKTKTLCFKKKNRYSNFRPDFYYGGILLDKVQKYKYLGIIMNENMTDEDDIDRLRNSFNKSAGSFYRKFYSLPFNLKFNLFKVLCTSLFGSQLWLDKAKTAKSFTKFSVSYHLALKKLLGFPKFFSNHIACSILNVFTLRHQVHFNVLKFFLWLKECKSICFSFHRNYFLRFSYFRRLLDSLF